MNGGREAVLDDGVQEGGGRRRRGGVEVKRLGLALSLALTLALGVARLFVEGGREVDLQPQPHPLVQLAQGADPGQLLALLGPRRPLLRGQRLVALVGGLIADVVRLVVEHQHAGPAAQALGQGRALGFELLRVRAEQQQLVGGLGALWRRRARLGPSVELVDVRDDERRLVGPQGPGAALGVIDRQAPVLTELCGQHRVGVEDGRAPLGPEVSEQAVLDEEVRGDEQGLGAQAERAGALAQGVEHRPRDEQTHHLGLAGAGGELAAELGPRVDLGHLRRKPERRAQGVAAPQPADLVHIDEGLDRPPLVRPVAKAALGQVVHAAAKPVAQQGAAGLGQGALIGPRGLVGAGRRPGLGCAQQGPAAPGVDPRPQGLDHRVYALALGSVGGGHQRTSTLSTVRPSLPNTSVTFTAIW